MRLPESRPLRITIGIISAIVLLAIGTAIGAAGNHPATTNPPPPTVVTAPAPSPETITVTASPPTPGPGSVLVNHSGSNENWNSSPFNVGTGPVTVAYSYSNCPDGSGNFIADLKATDGGDDVSIANVIGSGGSLNTPEYPQESGGTYYLAVQTECDYSIKVTSGG